MIYVLTINTILILLGVGSLLFSGEVQPHLRLIDLVTLGGFIVLQGVLFFRLKSLLGFVRVLLYTMALLQGLRLFLSIDQLLSLSGIINGLIIFLMIMYLLGIRGFLNSAKGMSYFGVIVPSHEVVIKDE